jgi:hypothetical protein
MSGSSYLLIGAIAPLLKLLIPAQRDPPRSIPAHDVAVEVCR